MFKPHREIDCEQACAISSLVFAHASRLWRHNQRQSQTILGAQVNRAWDTRGGHTVRHPVYHLRNSRLSFIEQASLPAEPCRISQHHMLRHCQLEFDEPVFERFTKTLLSTCNSYTFLKNINCCLSSMRLSATQSNHISGTQTANFVLRNTVRWCAVQLGRCYSSPSHVHVATWLRSQMLRGRHTLCS